ncbi:unnamed protein product [Trichobilharzia regenti]|nr:unnamed protein product [Trichobilharzia regenti]
MTANPPPNVKINSPVGNELIRTITATTVMCTVILAIQLQ